MTKEATDRQLEILEALRRTLGRDRIPTFKNIAEEADCCQTYAYQAILSLAHKGLVTRVPRKHGAIDIVEGA